MITINGLIINTQSRFPDGTMNLKWDNLGLPCYRITWKYESEDELLALIYLVNHIRTNCFNTPRIQLYMPYCPNARMDRVKNKDEIFTLRYFANIINSLNFDIVEILDPHSNVAPALIDRVQIKTPEEYIQKAYESIKEETNNDLIFFYPDEGAMKRYSNNNLGVPYCFGVKNRDWRTGQIQGLDIVGDENLIKDKNILIIDDICSRGGTFYHSVKKLKELGANKIYLYVTHCENTVLEGKIINSDLIEKMYTTDSIFTKKHSKIEVI